MRGKQIVSLLVSGFIITSPVISTSNDTGKVFRKVANSVVIVKAFSNDEYFAQGSGVLLDDAQTIITNLHVVDSCDQVIIEFPDGRKYRARGYIAFDNKNDLITIRLPMRVKGIERIEIGDVKNRDIGNKVIAISNFITKHILNNYNINHEKVANRIDDLFSENAMFLKENFSKSHDVFNDARNIYGTTVDGLRPSNYHRGVASGSLMPGGNNNPSNTMTTATATDLNHIVNDEYDENDDILELLATHNSPVEFIKIIKSFKYNLLDNCELHVLFQDDRRDIIEYLLGNKVKMNINKYRYSKKNMFQLLIDNESNSSAFELLIGHNYIIADDDIIYCLQNHEYDIFLTICTNTAQVKRIIHANPNVIDIYDCMLNNQIRLLDYLMETCNVDINKYTNEYRKDNESICKTFIDSETNVGFELLTKYNYTWLYDDILYAVTKGNLTCLRQAYEGSFNFDSNIFKQAIKHKQPDILIFLCEIECPYDIDIDINHKKRRIT